MTERRGSSTKSTLSQRDSDVGSTDDDIHETMSTISESFGGGIGGNNRLQHNVNDKNYISGYLLKKSKDGVWQKRYFETNGTFLTYYKSKKMTKLLAALNMSSVGEITLGGNINDDLGEGVVFQLELKDRNYVLRAKDMAEAQRWIQGLTILRNESKANVIPEESTTEETKSGTSQSTRLVESVNIDSKKNSTSSNSGKKDSDGFVKSESKEGCCIIL
mmetsp:Transcript_24711/g.25343  ORF Transcript_24711/g.25343 Transcript_24711/m.25343 type:complete len:218 (+) Transcript_24711:59-712(+)